ncbi:phosphotransferase [Thalassotalea ponticola]|uniref:aminoglycoside phosphotransferase family protein n=1 Tax=Thalassotalea ponticola TaxID=1523392 RepID=UPI0025B2F1A9|nr:phosphotransferase [Thalassotalea ponticola]MDN3653620.1 phosphotransferase [Thalassotalea ponticola]
MSLSCRTEALCNWLEQQFSTDFIHLTALKGDAGFRRYFRFVHQNQSYIAVDSPADKCNNASFISIAKTLKAHAVKVPEIYACDQRNGFFCIEDFGNCLLSDKLSEHTMLGYYQQALVELDKIQTVQAVDGYSLTSYDGPFLQQEMAIFSQWLVAEYLNISLSQQQQRQLQHCFDILESSALAQPQCFVHRDFHSRNLMLTNDNQLAVIDFQDAVIGPVTYDLVSLLRDCYVRWPDALVCPLFAQYYQKFCRTAGQQFAEQISYDQFYQWFELMGLQRHIKASGIFARLYLRDNKPGYLADIPLTLSYIVDVCGRYPQLQFLGDLVANIVLPAIKDKGADA